MVDVGLSNDVPELVVSDSDQLRRAIADPYGYLNRVESVLPVPWGNLKSLYR